MKPLETTPTIRIPDLSEIPRSNSSAIDKLHERESANIVEGYTITPNTTDNLPFKFYAEININNSRLWSLFKAFVLKFPEEVSFIFNQIDEDILYGEYQDKYTILNLIEQYSIELTQDSFIEFGIIYNSVNFLEEIFVDSTKYLKYWGMNEKAFRETITKFDLLEISDLHFVDEYPLVRENLKLHRQDINETYLIIDRFKEQFVHNHNY